MAHSLPTLVIVGLGMILAVARITRFVTADTLAEPARAWIQERARLRPNDDGTARLAPRPWRYSAKLVTCHWCFSVWAAAPLSTGYTAFATGQCPLHWSWAVHFTNVLGWLATSHLVATAADWLDSPPPVKPLHVTLTRDDRR
jgi:uncharacterized protein DUF1360